MKIQTAVPAFLRTRGSHLINIDLLVCHVERGILLAIALQTARRSSSELEHDGVIAAVRVRVRGSVRVCLAPLGIAPR